MAVALITGASSGIGLELAKVFARNQINLILVARSEDKLKEIKSELESKFSISVKLQIFDLSLLDSAEKLYEEVKNEKIDYLVNNAGFGMFGEFENQDIAKLEQMLILNVVTLTKLTRLLIPILEQSKDPHILNVASNASFQPVPYFASYGATKAYVLNFSEAIGYELKDKGIKVNALCPGATTSNFQKTSEMEKSGFMKSQIFATSKEVAEFGFKSMMKGKSVAVYGFMNNLQIFLSRFAPRSLVTMVSGMVAK